MPITHAFVSAKSDGGDATLVRPGDWNATHVGANGFDEAVTVKDTAGGADLTTTSTSFTDVTGATATLTTAAVRCMVMVSVMCNNSNAGQAVYFDVDIDGTRFANTTNGIAGMVGTVRMPVAFTFFTNVLTAASHTIKLQWRVSANTAGMSHQTTNSPIVFQVVETTLAT
jgi:hypothetical protein